MKRSETVLTCSILLPSALHFTIRLEALGNKVTFLDNNNTHDSVQNLIDDVILAQSNTSNFLEVLDSLKSVFQQYPLARAYVEHNQGSFHYRKGIAGNPKSFEQAIINFDSAVKLWSTQINEFSKYLAADIANGYSNIANCYLQLNQPYKSLEFVLQGLNFVQDLEMTEDLLHRYLKLNLFAARAYDFIGDFDNTVSHYLNIVEPKYSFTQEKLKIWKPIAFDRNRWCIKCKPKPA